MAGELKSEKERLQTLREYRILDTEPDVLFDEITKLASRICDTPISLITLVDEKRQWFKSRVGFDAPETDRALSICSHAIQQPEEVLVVGDLSKDGRFSGNPFVTGEAHIRFYGGVPLVDSHGFALGTLCVLDSKPRELSELQITALRTLARSVMTIMEQKKRNQLFHYFSENLFEPINFSNPYFLVIDKEHQIRMHGINFKKILPEISIEKSFSDFFEWEVPLNLSLIFAGDKGYFDKLIFLRCKNKPLRFKGSFRLFDGFILMLCTPVINSMTGISEYGITLSDVPRHEYISEYLFLQQTTQRALKDSQSITEKLRTRNRELIDAQKEILSISNFPAENPNPILRFDEQLRLLYTNDAATQFVSDFGITYHGVEDDTLRNLIAGGFQEARGLQSIILKRNDRIYSTYVRFVEEKKYVNVYANDITSFVNELNEKERELALKNSELENIRQELEVSLKNETELNNLKSRFISMASHEFRTPLTTIQSSAELLDMMLAKQSISEPEKIKKFIKRIDSEVMRLTGLMNDILLMGRVDSGKMPFSPEPADLVSYLHEWLESNVFEYSENRKIVIKVQGNQRPVMVDPSLFNHIVNNLVSNAYKYSQGKQAPEIILDFGLEKFTLRIKDYGIGIPQTEHQRIFESFQRASNSASIVGTGLGLAIVKQFVDMHGGTIDLVSRENEGTTVTIIIPA